VFKIWVFCHRKNWIRSISALNFFSKVCIIVVSPVIPVCLKVYQPFFLCFISLLVLQHKLLTRSSWFDKYKCNKLSIAPVRISETSASLTTTPPSLSKSEFSFFYVLVFLNFSIIIKTGKQTLISLLYNILHSLIVSLNTQINFVHNLLYFGSNVLMFRNVRNIESSLFKIKLMFFGTWFEIFLRRGFDSSE
jgi:hypothetical protein